MHVFPSTMSVCLFSCLFFTTYPNLVSLVVPNEDGRADHQECQGHFDGLCDVPGENEEEGLNNDEDLAKLNKGLAVL